MQVDFLQASLECAAAIVPKKLVMPRAKLKLHGPRFRSAGLHISPDALLERMAGIVKNANVSEPDIVQLFEMARNYFSILEKEAPMDVDAIEIVAQQISYVTGLLSTASYSMAQRYQMGLKGLQGDKLRLIEEKDHIFSGLEADRRKGQEYLDKSKALEQKMKQLTQDVDGYMQDVIQARKDIEDIHKKREELEKWCWVPFYNIYLYVDSERAEATLDSCMNRLRTAENNRLSLLRERENLCNNIIQTQKLEAETKVRLTANEQALQKCIEAINQAKSKALQYSDFTVFFGKINASLENRDADLEFVTGVLAEIITMFEQIVSKK